MRCLRYGFRLRGVLQRAGTCIARAVVALALVGTPAFGRGIGTDLASLNLCLYGDCEARGSYAADPWGLYNPGVLPLAVHDHLLSRGMVLSGSYYHLDIGRVGGDVGSGVVTLAREPVVFQVATAYADADGPVDGLPGVDMVFRTTAVRLAAGIDAERVLGLSGLCLGLAGVVPGTTSRLTLSTHGFRFAESEETRDLELVPGLHWHGGTRDWAMFGAFADVLRNDVVTTGVDPTTGRPLRNSGTTRTLFARGGTSLLPFVPLGLADGSAPRAQWLSDVRLGIDVEYRSVGIPGEGTTTGATAYFGIDGPLLPDAWNPLARWMRLWLIAGIDTRGGWGIGGGLYGEGHLRFLSCNPTYSSRPLTQVIGPRVDAAVVTCSAVVPF